MAHTTLSSVGDMNMSMILGAILLFFGGKTFTKDSSVKELKNNHPDITGHQVNESKKESVKPEETHS